MKKINYNKATMAEIESMYKGIFIALLPTMQSAWVPYRDKLRLKSTSLIKNVLYPDDISSYFCMPYKDLVEVYIDYHDCIGENSNPKDKNTHEGLKKLFHYSGEEEPTISAMQPLIANFFMKHADDLDVYVCHYCETSYINVYGMNNGSYGDIAGFLLTASEEKIRQYVRGSNGKHLSDKTIKSIYKLRINCDRSTIIDKFDTMGHWAHMNPSKSEQVKCLLRNHFDLDHFLPKSECPLLGLSLYNFVPSCSVCNEKLKGADRVGQLDRTQLLKLSPTSEQYNFDTEMNINIIPTTGASMFKTLQNKDAFRLEFLPVNSDYQQIVGEFQLEPRYNYHKAIALRDYDRYQDYSPAVIKMFSTVLKDAKTLTEIEDDIFGVSFDENEHRCFCKLKRDIKKQAGR